MAESNPLTIQEAVERYHQALVRHLELLVGDRHIAEELAQDIWLLIESGRKKHDPDGAPYWIWLTWLARQRAFVHNRRTRNHPVSPLIDESNGPTDDSGDQEALHRELSEYVERLDFESRWLIERYYFEGWSCREIAEATGDPVGTVHRRLHTARQSLRRLLAPMMD